MPFQLAPLVSRDEGIPGQVRLALAEGRLEEAGTLLMDAFELTCEEASELVDLDLCSR